MSGTETKEPATPVDAITVEVIRGFLETVADEMSLTMKRTAVTPIFSESSDYSCAVMDGRARLMAQAPRTASLPVHMGAMKFSVEAVLRAFAGESQKPAANSGSPTVMSGTSSVKKVSG